MTEWATSRQRHDGGSAPSALYRQHHDVEAQRIDERNFRPAWRVLRGLTGCLPITRSHRRSGMPPPISASSFDQVRCRAFTRSSAFGTVRATGNSFRNWVAGDLDASARLRQIRAMLGAWAYTLLEAALVRDLSRPRSGGTIAAIRKPRALG
jgi:hypothetical protein